MSDVEPPRPVPARPPAAATRRPPIPPPGAGHRPPGPPHHSGTLFQELLRTLTGAVAVTVGALSTGWPENLFQWLLLVIAAMLGGIAPHTQASDFVRARAGRVLGSWRPSRPLRLRRLLLIGLAVLLAASFGRSLLAGGTRLTEWGAARVFGCAAATQLRVLTSEEDLAATQELTQAYVRNTAREHFGCPAVNIYVYAQPVEKAREGLLRGWLSDSLTALGPRPDLWLPGSTRYVPSGIGNSNGELRGARTTSMASTPLVLAVPSGVVPEDLRERRSDLTWAAALARLTELGWGVARPDPASSVTGEFVTAALYGGVSEADPESADPPALVDQGRARQAEAQVARGLDGGYPLGDAAGLLCYRRQHQDPPPGALALTEQQLVRFNAGAKLNASCPGGQNAAGPDDSLFAVYPQPRLDLDMPMVELEWKTRSPEQAELIADFRAWLGGDDGKGALNQIGLRPYDWSPVLPLNEQFGVQPGLRDPAPPPSAETLRQVHALWELARRPGRVLLALDASGSMKQAAGSTGQSRFDVAVQGVGNVFDQMSNRDEFGLWVFQGPNPAPRQLLPIGRLGLGESGAAHRSTVVAAMGGVRPGGGTPLYRAMVDGIRAVGPADAERTSALVVLTDGIEDGSGVSASTLLAAARAGGVRVFVVAVGEAGCANTTIAEVVRSTSGACYQTDLANLDRRLGELFGTLWGGIDQ